MERNEAKREDLEDPNSAAMLGGGVHSGVVLPHNGESSVDGHSEQKL